MLFPFNHDVSCLFHSFLTDNESKYKSQNNDLWGIKVAFFYFPFFPLLSELRTFVHSHWWVGVYQFSLSCRLELKVSVIIDKVNWNLEDMSKHHEMFSTESLHYETYIWAINWWKWQENCIFRVLIITNCIFLSLNFIKLFESLAMSSKQVSTEWQWNVINCADHKGDEQSLEEQLPNLIPQSIDQSLAITYFVTNITPWQHFIHLRPDWNSSL